MERGGINNEVLINEVSKRRSLWDQKSLEYLNRSLKCKEWEQVALELNAPVDEIKNRWKLLKDSFNREVRNITRNNNTAKWAHFEQMSFLLKGSNSLLLPSAYLSQSLVEIDNQSASSCDNDPSTSSIYTPEENYSPTPKRKKPKISNFQSSDFYSSTPAVDWSGHDHGNEDYLFLMSLLPTFEKMSARQKMRVKIKMMQDVYDAVFNDSVSEHSSSKNDSVDSGLSSSVSSGS